MQKDQLISESSFLQSRDWAEFQEELGRTAFRIRKDDFEALILKYPLRFYGTYLYAPRVGLRSLDDLDFLISEAKKIAHKERSVFLRVEPAATISLSTAGFSKIASLQPDTTLIMNLSKSADEILKQMDHDTRYSIRTAEKRGVKVLSSKEIGLSKALDEFWAMFLETNKRQGLGHYGKKYYEELSRLDGEMKSEILLAELDGKYIAGAIILYYKNTATYLYAASLTGYGRYNAPSYVIWKAMLRAKEKGMKYFDFWGISDENKRWARFSAFKRSFGGEEVHYPGTFDLPLNKPLYHIYQLAKRFIR